MEVIPDVLHVEVQLFHVGVLRLGLTVELLLGKGDWGDGDADRLADELGIANRRQILADDVNIILACKHIERSC